MISEIGQNEFQKFDLVKKFEYFLFLLQSDSKLTILDQLAILTFFRMEISNAAKTNMVKELLQKTFLMNLLTQILASDKSIKLMRYM